MEAQVCYYVGMAHSWNVGGWEGTCAPSGPLIPMPIQGGIELTKIWLTFCQCSLSLQTRVILNCGSWFTKEVMQLQWDNQFAIQYHEYTSQHHLHNQTRVSDCLSKASNFTRTMVWAMIAMKPREDLCYRRPLQSLSIFIKCSKEQ